MARPAAQRWAKIIDEQEASGLTIREFAHRNGIKLGTLSWWRSHLGRTHRRTAASRFLEVVVGEAPQSSLTLTLPHLRAELVIDHSRPHPRAQTAPRPVLIPTPSRILIAREPVDFRKQIDGLAAVCEVHLGEQPLDGTLFLFRNRRKNALKSLVWTHGGLYSDVQEAREG